MALTEGTDSFGVLEGRRGGGRRATAKKAALYGGAAILTGGVGVGLLAARAAYKRRQAQRAKARERQRALYMENLKRQEMERERRDAERRQQATPRAKEVAALHGFGALYEEDGLSGKVSLKKFKKIGGILKPFGGVLLTVGKFVPGVSSVIAVGEKAAKYGGPLVSAAKNAKKKMNEKRKALGLGPVSEAAIEGAAQAEMDAAARAGKPISLDTAIAKAEVDLQKGLTPGSPQSAAVANEAASEDAVARAEASAAAARRALPPTTIPGVAGAPSPMKKYAPWAVAAVAIAAAWAWSRRKRS
jgi:MYXO-CTERM domain-containing protein